MDSGDTAAIPHLVLSTGPTSERLIRTEVPKGSKELRFARVPTTCAASSTAKDHTIAQQGNHTRKWKSGT
eukprot:108331-Amphidinium_carterae.1